MAVDKKLVTKVMAVVGTAGPIVADYLRKNPQIGQSVNDAVTKLLAKRTSSPDGMIDTIAVLRDQVAYLRGSADNAEESRRAERWSKQLDNLDHAAVLLRDGASRSEKKVVREKLVTLRGEILAAFVAEQAEDSEQRQIEG